MRTSVNFGDARLPERFWDKVVPEPNSGCWLWVGKLNRDEYGDLTFRRRNTLAHRLSYEATVGAIPAGLVVDHKCRVTCCVNPAHLEPVTNRENLRRGLLGVLKTSCSQGHQYDEENTYIHTNKHGVRRRFCRACNRAAAKRSKAVQP